MTDKRALFSEIGVSTSPRPLSFFGRTALAFSTGPELIQEMAELFDTEPAVKTSHNMTTLAAAQADWSVVPASEEPIDIEAAAFVQSCMEDMSHTWRRFIEFAMSCQEFGYADVEVVYKRRDGQNPPKRRAKSLYDEGLIGVRKLAVRPQESLAHWEEDAEGGKQAFVQFQWRDGQLKKVPIPIEKLLHFVGGDTRGEWLGNGWLKIAYRFATMNENLTLIGGIGWQRSFMGLPVFQWTSPPLKEEDRAAVERIGRNLSINEQAFVQLPPNVTFKLETVQNGNAAALRSEIDQNRWEIMSLAAVAFMRLGTTQTGSRALASPLIDLFTAGVDSALDDIADTLNRHLVPRLILANALHFQKISGMPKFVHSQVTKLPLEVLNYLHGVTEFLATASGADAAWVRNIIGMPQEVVEEKADRVVPEPEVEQGAGYSDAVDLELPNRVIAWATVQAKELQRLGLAPTMAVRIVAEVLESLPSSVLQDPHVEELLRTWTIPVGELAPREISDADQAMAAQTWSEQATERFRRILQAKEAVADA